MKKKVGVVISLLVLLVLVVVDYPIIDEVLEEFLVEGDYVVIGRVIDGDTVVTTEDEKIRLLGINTPEKKERYYEEAKEFLEGEVLNKSVRLEFEKNKYDQYGRMLAYLYLGEENVNLKIVENGLANFYFPSGRTMYYNRFKEAWENCVLNGDNLCEGSNEKCASCIQLKEFDYKKEFVTLYNRCEFSCDLTDWEIKDEGRKNFVFPEFVLMSGEDVSLVVGEKSSEDDLVWEGEEYVWTDSGDTLILRDSEGKLILWESY